METKNEKGGKVQPPSTIDNNEKKTTVRQPSRRGTPSQPFVNKFATIATDKYTQGLRRDLLLSNFDRNLTVEQAHFDPNESLAVPQENSMPNPATSTSSHSLNNNNINNTHNNNNTNIISNNSNMTNNNSNTSINTINNNSHSPPLGPMLTPPLENSNSLRRTNTKPETKKKPPKRTPIHSTASPSEYFHRNLVDAVSNVEDSDENEFYVYPYSGGEHSGNISDHYHSTAPRSLRNKKASEPRLLRYSVSAHELKQPSNQPHRPKLRSYVMDPHSARKEYGSTRPDNYLRSSKRLPSRRYLSAYQIADGYASDDESDPLIRNDRRKQSYRKCPLLWTVCVLFIFIILIFGLLIIGGAKPLQDVSISMGRVLASDKELIFDLHVKAYNPNGWTVHINDADISVFAFSHIVPTLAYDSTPLANSQLNETKILGADPAEYLGSISHFDEPLAIYSSLLSSQPSTAVSQIRIKSPGDDKGGNERWSRIIRYNYGLLARGVLSYYPLSMPGVHSQTVAICHVAEVNPTLGNISSSDQSYCSISDG
ncbi:unnamed protein product [Cunninghamella blakesleeana]